MLEEAAGELFLEQGYSATSVADITRRAGVSRSTFFNYFDQKSDLLWAGFDERVAALRTELTSFPGDPRASLFRLADDLPAEHVALAFTHSDAMGLGDELRQATARRIMEVADTLMLAGAHLDPMHARVAAVAWAGALIAAVQEWSRSGAARSRLTEHLGAALEPVATAFDRG